MKDLLMTRNSTVSALAVAILSTFAVGGQAIASPIIGNAALQTAFGSDSNPLTIAVEFTTGAFVQSLGSAIFYIGATNGTTVAVSLHAADAGMPMAPGALLETLNAPTIGAVSQPTTFTGAPFTLAANTRYWIEVDATAGDFSFGQGLTPTGPGATYDRDYYSEPFFETYGLIPRFEVDAAQNVSEPATVALFGGAAMLGWTLRLRRGKARFSTCAS